MVNVKLMASGMSKDDILADYPDLEAEDLVAAPEFGALTAGRRRILLQLTRVPTPAACG